MKQPTRDEAPVDVVIANPRTAPVVALVCAGLALLLYGWSAAPGLTWAHEAADGGELLAAAWSRGVPHPPGYPLYTVLLRLWLTAGRWLNPAGDLARFGNLLSVLCAAAGVGVTVLVAGYVLSPARWRWVWAALAGLAWTWSPLLWGQAVVAEVYALHTLLVALLGWAVLNRSGRWRYLIPVVACGVAHHLTFILLLPAVIYLLWQADGGTLRALMERTAVMAVAVGLGLLFYLRTPLAAGALPVPPVNWGYADNWTGFWWLVSGAAYRRYLFAGANSDLFARLTGWSYTITNQYTPVGLAVGLVGLATWDREQPVLRNFSILWVVPVSLYAIAYHTRDSEIYLLPVAWMMAIWIAVGLQELAALGSRRWSRRPLAAIVAGFTLAALVGLLVLRFPSMSLRTDHTAQMFLRQASAELEPGAIIVSLADEQTFALWYGAWASGELQEAAPGLVLINYSLYQFDWYRRLLRAEYPDVVTDQRSVEEILATQVGKRAIFFSEPLAQVPASNLTPQGPLWRYRPSR